MVLKEAFICDLDGTLCNHEHRRHFVEGKHKNFEKFHELCPLDEPNPHVYFMYQLLMDVPDLDPIITTGRPESYRAETELWLRRNGIIYEKLFMRPVTENGVDGIDDALLKKGFLDTLRGKLGYKILFAIDDRQKVVDMWRANGVPCFQAAPGDF